jgi:hypothetical protein
MAIIAELVVTIVFILVSILSTQTLINIGAIHLEPYIIAPLVTIIGILTIAINKATAYIVGLIIENKEMKDEKTLRTLLKEELEKALTPLTTKVETLDDKLTVVVEDVAFLKVKEEAKRELANK